MSFREAVESIPHLGAGALMPGLQALKAVDRARVTCAKPRVLKGSLDLDTRLQPAFPQDPRWDYAVCVSRSGDRVFWIEVHPATDGNVREVERKFQWLRQWLSGDGTPLNQFDAEFVWISSGRTTLT